jgi:uncharacterized protein Usg
MRTRGFSPVLELQLDGYRLTTAEILYHMPDYPELLQSFTWQLLDKPPRFPRLLDFLDHWERRIEGALHSVMVMHAGVIQPARYRYVDHELRLD